MTLNMNRSNETFINHSVRGKCEIKNQNNFDIKNNFPFEFFLKQLKLFLDSLKCFLLFTLVTTLIQYEKGRRLGYGLFISADIYTAHVAFYPR
jgi:hypothetical protein